MKIKESFNILIVKCAELYQDIARKCIYKHSVIHACVHGTLALTLFLTHMSVYRIHTYAAEYDVAKNSIVQTYYDDIFKVIKTEKEKKDIQSAPPITKVKVEPKPMEQWENYGVCAYSSAKTYEEGNIRWDPTSTQFQIMNTLHINDRGMYESVDGYLAVALGSYYGPVGSKFKITLDSGIVLKVIKADAKADKDTVNGCSQRTDGSILEFVINEPTAFRFFPSTNGYVNNGNFNNHTDYQGTIVKVEKLV